jgi:hypothetical protein
LEALLSSRLTGVQLRIILWVIRHTAGWNRTLTPFSWYRIAKKIGGNRAVVWRAGRTLLGPMFSFWKMVNWGSKRTTTNGGSPSSRGL